MSQDVTCEHKLSSLDTKTTSLSKYDYQRLLLFGYIRIFSRNFDRIIPMEIMDLCLMFYSKCINIAGYSQILDDSLLINLDKVLTSMINISSSMLTLLYSEFSPCSSRQFHRQCDHKGATLTICRNSNGHIFGGYTSKSWQLETNQYVQDKDAFLFVLHPNMEIFTIKPDKIDYATYHYKNQGPSFGLLDLHIRSSVSTGQTFCDDPTYLNVTPDKIAGGREWDVVQYEVFSISEFNLSELMQSKITSDNWCNISDIESSFYQSILLNNKEYIIICNQYYWALYDVQSDTYTRHLWLKDIQKLKISLDTYCVCASNHILYAYSVKNNMLITINYKTNMVLHNIISKLHTTNDMQARLVCVDQDVYLYLTQTNNKNSFRLDLNQMKLEDSNLLLTPSTSKIVYVKNLHKLYVVSCGDIYYLDLDTDHWKKHEMNVPDIGEQIICSYDDILFFFRQSTRSVWCLDLWSNKYIKSPKLIGYEYSYLPTIIKDVNNYLHFSGYMFAHKIALSDFGTPQLMEFAHSVQLQYEIEEPINYENNRLGLMGKIAIGVAGVIGVGFVIFAKLTQKQNYKLQNLKIK